MAKTNVAGVGASADATIDQIVDSKSFGNLAKLVPITIIGTGIAVALVVVTVQGGNQEAVLSGALTFVSFAVSGFVGSVTAWQGKSQTQMDMQAVRNAQTVPFATSAGIIRVLPVGSEQIHGRWDVNKDQPAEPAAEVVDPMLTQVDPAPVDPTITPGKTTE